MTVLSLTWESPYLGKMVFILKTEASTPVMVIWDLSEHKDGVLPAQVSHYKDKMVSWLSDLYHGNSYSIKRQSLYWKEALMFAITCILNVSWYFAWEHDRKPLCCLWEWNMSCLSWVENLTKIVPSELLGLVQYHVIFDNDILRVSSFTNSLPKLCPIDTLRLRRPFQMYFLEWKCVDFV